VTDLTDASSNNTLVGRPAGASVIAACLSEQSRLLPRKKRLADVLGVSPLAEGAVPWFTGAVGERIVGRELERLGPEWTVLHAVPVGTRDSDIDHVVIGPAGVFTINTKHHAGQRVSTGRTQVFVSGKSHNYIRNSIFEAERASKLLSEVAGFPVAARLVLAFVGAKEISGNREVNGVRVAGATGLVRWLSKQPAIWGPEGVAAVADAAKRPASWRGTATLPGAAVDSANLTAFGELQRHVSLMAAVRALWGFGGLAALLGVVWLALTALHP
jgi:hypothetical protein